MIIRRQYKSFIFWTVALATYFCIGVSNAEVQENQENQENQKKQNGFIIKKVVKQKISKNSRPKKRSKKPISKATMIAKATETAPNPVVTTTPALAPQTTPTSTPQTATTSEIIEQQFLEGNQAVSTWLDRVAERIDLFLVGKRSSKKKNGTSGKIQSSTFSAEGKPVVSTFSVGLNPRFPNLEEFLQLKFTATEDRDETRRAVVSNSSDANLVERKYTTPTDLFKKLGKIKTTFQPKISIGNPIKLSHSLNFESAANFKSSIINPKLELFADADRGTGLYNAINFQFTLAPRYSLVLINDAEYLDKLHTYTVNNGFSVSQVMTDRITFAYSFIFTSNNKIHYHLENYTAAFAWNEEYYKKVLDLQFIPQLDFQKERGFKGAAGITFNISLHF